jgi:hypothetical protein
MGVPAGPWYIDDTLTFTAITHRFDTGALTDADAVPAYRIYEDETGTAILTGNTAKLDDANTTGFYSEQITLSAANGFEAGKSYSIYVSAAVNSVTGGQTFNFKVINEPLRPTTAGRTLDVSAGGEAGIDWANVGSPTTAVNLSATNIDVDQVVASVSGAVGSVTGNVGGNVVGSVASVTAGVTVTTNNDKTGYALTASYDFAKGTTAMTESYAANGVAPTPVQAIYAIHQHLMDFSISGTSYTTKKLDDATTAFVVTLDDATTPTAASRT